MRQAVEAAGARFAVSEHWLKGGEGAIELAEAVVEACEEPVDLRNARRRKPEHRAPANASP